ncbi:MAG: DUF1405 domain-containing protein [Firmicutes bacterium]|nr:DUF1405 domain-containing protein [Bacillota bacterium]
MNALKWLWKDLWQNPWQPKYMWPLIIINIVGSALGYWWYRGQLMQNPWHLWILISDSPLSTTVFAIALLLACVWRRIPFLTAVGLATTFKYGLWALVVLTHYWFVTHDVGLVEIGLWLGHLGMVLEAFIFMRNAQVTCLAVMGVLAWMGLNDFVDYVFDLHPYLFLPSQFSLGMGAAVLITVSVGVLISKRALTRREW